MSLLKTAFFQEKAFQFFFLLGLKYKLAWDGQEKKKSFFNEIGALTVRLQHPGWVRLKEKQQKKK